MTNDIVIHWFRQDLRLHDNPALFNASGQGRVLPIYILDNENTQEYQMGAASHWWLHHSLKALNQSLDGKLSVYQGDAEKILLEIIKANTVKAVYWNRCYEPWRIHRDQKIKKMLKHQAIDVQSANGSLLWEPWQVLKSDGTPYKVFTPFFQKGYLKTVAPRKPLSIPTVLSLYTPRNRALNIDELALLPSIRWDVKLAPHWKIGEKGANEQLHRFLDEGISDYKCGRDFPAKKNVSQLSPHLHFGEVSPNQVWHAARFRVDDSNIEHFCLELGWREFSYHLLYHCPTLPKQNLNPKFNTIPWKRDWQLLTRWQHGKTGYPIVDAGMRELWQTGYMHNRVRMIVGSFLVKNLLLHWHHGERWFWDCLVDADLANNSASWQWIAGCGADAAPYFRIFNPVTQGQKFDSNGKYTRRWVPELSKLPDKYLFSPWEAPQDVLKHSGVTLGDHYPQPIIDLKSSRKRALEAFASVKK